MALVRFCDFCNRNMNHDTVFLLKVMGFKTEDREEGKPAMPPIELCPLCLDGLKKTLNSMREAGSAAQGA